MSEKTKYGYVAMNLGDRDKTFICWKVPELAETTGINPDTLHYNFSRRKAIQFLNGNWLIMRCRFVVGQNNHKGNIQNFK